MSTETPVILSALRTPIGKFQGGLASFSAPELGGKAVAEAIRRAGLDWNQIDEAILGNVVQAGLGQNPARQAALKGGCAPRVAALTIILFCVFRPVLVVRAAVAQQNVVGVLIDDSRSMQLADENGTRADLIRRSFGNPDSPIMKALSDRFLVRTFRFSSSTTRLTSGSFS